MFTTRRSPRVRAVLLLASSLTLGCQSVGPLSAPPTQTAYATAPAIVARAAPPTQQEISPVAAWQQGGEPDPQWRAAQRPEEAGSVSAWRPAPRVVETTFGVTPVASTAPPPVLPETLRGPALGAVRPNYPAPGAVAVRTHPPFPPGPPAAQVPPGGAPFETHMVSLPPYRIGPPDILLVESTYGLKEVQEVRGQHLVRPDGTVGLGIYGSVYVNGLTTDEARQAVARAIQAATPKKSLEDILKYTNVDVIAYNSQVYYVITDGAGAGQQVVAVPFTGRETVIDAVAKINGLSPVSSKHHIWVARRACDGVPQNQQLRVDWPGITERGETNTNYQIMPGDRVFVQSDPVRRFDTNLGKILSPVERLFGVTLLSSQAINSIRSGGVTGVR